MRIPVVDQFLNGITMYRLTLYYLIALVIAAMGLSFINLLPYNPWQIVVDSIIVVISCFIFNFVFSKLFRATTNIESVFITALIVALIVPVTNPNFLILASFFAMGSKYLVTIEKIHIFNPAAAGVVALAFLSFGNPAVWWVGTAWMVPFVLLGGLLLLRKLEREDMVFTFCIVYLVIIFITSFAHNANFASILNSLNAAIFRSPLLFFSFVMLTEPLTSPSSVRGRRVYAAITAFLYSTPQLRFGFAFTPELALCVGNIYSYIVNPKYKFFLKLKEKIQISPDIFLFNFGKIPNFRFVPGQYMEWTLHHPKTDTRGNRRYFSIASSPTEDLMIAVKFYKPSSSYKNALLSIDNEKKVIASSLTGEFVLPKKKDVPVAFIAGGVGIAPFRSIVQDIIDKNQPVNIVLLFANRTKEDIVFADLFEKAKGLGFNTIYTLTEKESIPQDWTGEIGRVTPEMIVRRIPDYKTRVFYISGPQPMVKSYQEILKSTGVSTKNIKVDYFPGYEDS